MKNEQRMKAFLTTEEAFFLCPILLFDMQWQTFDLTLNLKYNYCRQKRDAGTKVALPDGAPYFFYLTNFMNKEDSEYDYHNYPWSQG